MFGYVRPFRPELKCKDFDLYRATYCGLCRCLRRRYGLIAPMLLNFDFTFLALLLWEPEEGFTPCRGRCHANPLRKLPMGYFTEGNIGKISSVLSTDMVFIEENCMTALADMMSYIFAEAIMLAFLFVIHPWLGLAGCALMLVLFKMDGAAYITLLPKSITTAIGKGLSQELGGYPAITMVTIMITGLFGAVGAPALLRLFRITEPMAQGLAIGASSHAAGTSRAVELGDVQGAASSLAIVVTGLLTVAAAPLFAHLAG